MFYIASYIKRQMLACFYAATQLVFVKKKLSIVLAAIAIVVLKGSATAIAQDTDVAGPDTDIYAKAYGSFDYNKIDSINLENGTLNLSIPVFSYPQRGSALTLGFNIQYQSLQYSSQDGRCDSPDGSECGPTANWIVSGGLYLQPNFLIDADNPTRWYFPLANGVGHMATDGSGHQLFVCGDTGSPYPNQTVRIDASGTVYRQSCNQSGPSTESITDSNGNQIIGNMQNEGTYGGAYPNGLYSLQGWTDTMGRNIPLPSSVFGNQSSHWIVPGIYGSTVSYGFIGQEVIPMIRDFNGLKSCGDPAWCAVNYSLGFGLPSSPQYLVGGGGHIALVFLV
jgi:hypothetical protein